IIVIGACEPTRFVAKSEIRHWPVAGWLANGTGAFYIRRGKGGARPLLHQLIPHLQNNGCVCVFPEGTTTGGDNVLPFHPRLFAAAIEARCPVQPVAIRYGRAGNGEAIAPFVGDDELVSHVLRILKEPELFAEINYCPPFSPAGLKREQLASAAHGAVAAIIAPARFLQPEPALESVLA
ncbi:MAG: lysophospholipid acyltransferase family protein, partial [Stenotrophobium sp.]